MMNDNDEQPTQPSAVKRRLTTAERRAARIRKRVLSRVGSDSVVKNHGGNDDEIRNLVTSTTTATDAITTTATTTTPKTTTHVPVSPISPAAMPRQRRAVSEPEPQVPNTSGNASNTTDNSASDLKLILRSRRRVSMYTSLSRFLRTFLAIVLAVVWVFDLYSLVDPASPSDDASPFWSFVVMECMVFSAVYLLKRPHERAICDVIRRSGMNQDADEPDIMDGLMKVMDSVSKAMPPGILSTVERFGSVLIVLAYVRSVLDDFCVFVFSMIAVELIRFYLPIDMKRGVITQS